MTQAADIIAALLAGKPAPVIERHTGMPYGWGLWLRHLKERLGAIGRDTSDGIVAALAQRPLSPPEPRQPAMGRWQAFRAMFYPGWDAPLREERGLRWFAGATSLLMHLLFVLLLVLFALVGLPPPEAPAGDESRVQMEFIGEGTPEEEGGGPPAAEAADAAQAASASAQPAEAQPQASAQPVAAEAASTPPQEVAEVAPPVSQQNVQVTETPVATSDFVLPPVTERPLEFAQPQIKPLEVSVPTREVTVAVAPPVQRPLPQREIAVPQVSSAIPEVRQREIATPLPQVRNVQVPTRDLPTPSLRAATPGVRQAEIAMPNRGSSTSSSNAPATQATASGNAGQTAATTPQGTQPGATASGSVSANRPGASPTPRRGDDWGASTRNVPGQTGGNTNGEGAGLFNADGSARAPDSATGNASRPGAPGSKQQQRADADRASKWLERPEYPYEPTMFDKYWVPNESVLAEWVRRAIREVEVPIPGTSRKVKCVVSVLQAGGACGLYDPNLNEQPATARPPPDIPVKRNPIPTDS